MSIVSLLFVIVLFVIVLYNLYRLRGPERLQKEALCEILKNHSLLNAVDVENVSSVLGIIAEEFDVDLIEEKLDMTFKELCNHSRNRFDQISTLEFNEMVDDYFKDDGLRESEVEAILDKMTVAEFIAGLSNKGILLNYV